MNLATYTLQIIGPESDTGNPALGMAWMEADKRVLANLPAYVESWQEDMSDLLPEGYEVKIVEALS